MGRFCYGGGGGGELKRLRFEKRTKGAEGGVQGKISWEEENEVLIIKHYKV